VSNTYLVYNGPMVTTSAPSRVTTGTSAKTMLQVVPAVPLKVIEWGFSADSAPATPGIVELLTTGAVAATVTAYAAADVMPFFDPNAPVNSAGSSGTPLNLGTALSGYTSSAEGSITATRTGDLQSNNGPYVKQFPLGREFGVPAAGVLRIRATFGTAVNMLCYCIIEV
jgi:hypothetical protein